jgi:hypothetical protein
MIDVGYGTGYFTRRFAVDGQRIPIEKGPSER